VFAANALAARPEVRGKTVKDLSGSIPMGLFQSSVGRKFYRSLLISPLHDWSAVQARVVRGRLSGARVIRRASDPAYDSLALQVARDVMPGAHDAGKSAEQTDSAVMMHLLVYQIADGAMAVSFAHAETPAKGQLEGVAAVRISVQVNGGKWTEIRPSETGATKGWSIREPAGRRLRRMDRMPMDVISAPVR
jgi:hypothetical protein